VRLGERTTTLPRTSKACFKLESLLARGEAAKQAFKKHRNVEQTMSELRGVFETLFVRSSYLIGHIDGLEKTLDQEAPKFAADLRKTTWINLLWERYVEILRAMFEKIERW
jgi:hypothetical protein